MSLIKKLQIAALNLIGGDNFMVIENTCPPEMVQKEVQDLKIGESGWAVPWAVVVEKCGKLWIRRSFDVCPTPGGTITMKVIRTKQGIVIKNTDKYEFSQSAVDTDDYLPIIGVIPNKKEQHAN